MSSEIDGKRRRTGPQGFPITSAPSKAALSPKQAGQEKILPVKAYLISEPPVHGRRKGGTGDTERQLQYEKARIVNDEEKYDMTLDFKC